MHGVQAQNYHIMTPAVGKDRPWLGMPSYVKELPWANAAYNYNFKPGESGNWSWSSRSLLSTTPDAKARSAPSPQS